MDTEETPITATRILLHERVGFLPKHLGELCVAFETGCYDTLHQQTKEYRGGYWEFYELSNGGFYMAPTITPQGSEEGFTFDVHSNQFTGHMSADAAGIVASLVSLNQLCWKHCTDSLNDAYYALRDFAIEHAEHPAILGAID